MELQLGVPERESEVTVQDCEKEGEVVAARRMREPGSIFRFVDFLVAGGG